MFQTIIDKIGLEQTIINFVIVLGIILIYAYVIYNFIHAKKRKNKKKKEVKSIVETTSMSTAFQTVNKGKRVPLTQVQNYLTISVWNTRTLKTECQCMIRQTG